MSRTGESCQVDVLRASYLSFVLWKHPHRRPAKVQEDAPGNIICHKRRAFLGVYLHLLMQTLDHSTDTVSSNRTIFLPSERLSLSIFRPAFSLIAFSCWTRCSRSFHSTSTLSIREVFEFLVATSCLSLPNLFGMFGGRYIFCPMTLRRYQRFQVPPAWSIDRLVLEPLLDRWIMFYRCYCLLGYLWPNLKPSDCQRFWHLPVSDSSDSGSNGMCCAAASALCSPRIGLFWCSQFGTCSAFLSD